MTERVLAPILGVLLLAAALAQPARAEGGLPGSPVAVKPGTAAPPAAAPVVQPESLGGAIFNPFAAPASARGPQQAPGYALRSGRAAPTTTNSPGTR